jgi:hypothetical protein
VNKSGIYAVQFFIEGKQEIVYVDEYLPVDPITGKLAFAHSEHQGLEIWICLIEKAWAKLHGSYGAIVSSSSDKVYPHLINKPAVYTDLKKKEDTGEPRIDRDALWAKLTSALEMGCLVTVGSPADSEK